MCIRDSAKDGFYFSVGDEEDEAALLRGDKKGVGGHIELNFRDDDDEREEEDAEDVYKRQAEITSADWQTTTQRCLDVPAVRS